MDREEIIKEISDHADSNYNLKRRGIVMLADWHIAELKKARREVAKEIRADIWRENRNVHNRWADIVKAVFVKLEEIIDQNKVDEG